MGSFAGAEWDEGDRHGTILVKRFANERTFFRQVEIHMGTTEAGNGPTARLCRVLAVNGGAPRRRLQTPPATDEQQLANMHKELIGKQ
jgi:hypothetical protein